MNDAFPAGPGRPRRASARRELAGTLLCPFCGQPNELEIDTSQGSQRFHTDCEVCCRPFEVVAECEPGALLRLAAVPG